MDLAAPRFCSLAFLSCWVHGPSPGQCPDTCIRAATLVRGVFRRSPIVGGVMGRAIIVFPWALQSV